MIKLPTRSSLSNFLNHGPYVGYCYSYPHKSAYREFPNPKMLSEVWNGEKTDHMFLYLHVPFCEMRCGFCNLFTFSQPDSEIPFQYLATIKRHAKIIKNEIDQPRFSQVAIGGGTPTFLNSFELEQLCTLLADMGIAGSKVPISIEASPATIVIEKLRMLRDFGVHRISMGIQSFNAQDVGQLGRPQKKQQVYKAIEAIQQFDFPIFNLDLIYGAAGQTIESWNNSIREVLSIRPNEVFLYPLYVRPLTGLGNRKSVQSASGNNDHRIAMYRLGRGQLLNAGYEQTSMRMFALPNESAPTEYRCQEDGMIGLGVGARSYTSNLHYSSRYAVEQKSIGKIIEDYVNKSDSELATIDYGFELNREETLRRGVILSLLQVQGLDRGEYRNQFKIDVIDQFPELQELESCGVANIKRNRILLTDRGIELSDAIGPWLYSDNVRNRMNNYSWN